MKFNLPVTPAPFEDDERLAVGNVYAAKGGKPTRFWVVVGIRASTVILLGIDGEGALCSAATYASHVFDSESRYNRPILGRCENLDDMSFDITWRMKP